MAGWNDEARREGREYAARILAELVELRDGGDPIGARLLVDEAATHQPVGTIAHALAMAESLIHRMADLTGESGRHVLHEFLLETAGDRSDDALSAVGAGKPRRLRRAKRSA